MTAHQGRDFHEFATEGSSIAHVNFEPSDFEAAIAELNKRFRRKFVAREGLYEEILWGLRRAAGRFRQEKYPIERPAVARRLKKLRAYAEYGALALQAMDLGFQDEHDLAVIRLLRDAIRAHHPALSPEEVDRQLELIREALAALYIWSEDAEAILRQMGSKKGRRGLSWYDAFFEVLLKAAHGLGIPLTTAGDRSRDPHATPLTVLAHELERSLPNEARAKTFAACAKRVQERLSKRTRE
jgi:hypothetical protein